VWKYSRHPSNLQLLRIGEEKRKKKTEEETAAAKYNGLPYWAAIKRMR